MSVLFSSFPDYLAQPQRHATITIYQYVVLGQRGGSPDPGRRRGGKSTERKWEGSGEGRGGEGREGRGGEGRGGEHMRSQNVAGSWRNM